MLSLSLLFSALNHERDLLDRCSLETLDFFIRLAKHLLEEIRLSVAIDLSIHHIGFQSMSKHSLLAPFRLKNHRISTLECSKGDYLETRLEQCLAFQ